MEVKISESAFNARVEKLQSALSTHKDAFGGADSVLLLIGKGGDDNPYIKTAVAQNWLLGYEFFSTALLVTPARAIFVTNASKAVHLEGLKKDGKVEVWVRPKEGGKELMEKLVQVAKEAGDKVGVVLKDVFRGPIVDEVEAALKDSGIEKVDIEVGLSHLLETKDDDEIKSIRVASRASTAYLTKFFTDQMLGIVDEERRLSHSKFSEQIENKLQDEGFFAQNQVKLGSDFHQTNLEWCYMPIIQSGGKYDLRPSAVSDDANLHGGTIVCTLGTRYKGYCSNVGRTFMINPTKAQEQNYEVLIGLREKVFDSIKVGVKACDVYNAAVSYIKSKAPKLEAHLLKTIGWSIGIDFRDAKFLLNAKCQREIVDGSTFDVSLGFQNLSNPAATDPKNKLYSLALVDTIRVTRAGVAVLTDSAPVALSEVTYFFEDDDDEADKEKKRKEQAKKEKKQQQAAATVSSITRTKLRHEARAEDNNDQKRKDDQKALHEKLNKAGLERFKNTEGALNGEEKVVIKKFESYKRDTQLPQNLLRDLRVHVDTRSQSIILPINGRPVPFHINTYKSGSKTDEGDYVYIRLNLSSPGQIAGSKKDAPQVFEDPDAQFLRSITFRSRHVEHMNDVFKQIQDLKKASTKKEAEKKEMEDVVAQDSLVEVRARRPLKLDAVFVRPAPDGKRVAGTLEIHQNGLRYVSPIRSDHKIDVLFDNIKHLFFQPTEGELIVCIHAHLKNPILIGKKKTWDVQFYREASDMAFDETGNRKRKYRYGDEDELEAEQEERRRRLQLDKEFKAFSEKISEASDRKVDVDTPFRELGFHGVPFRSNVLLQPSADCLVQLIDTPFSVITLGEIELAHLERVQFGLKNFDLVFVYKDFNKPVTHINSIPVDQLDAVKDWLNEVEIPYSEGPVNLNWGSIMKTVVADPQEFFTSGGWSFLDLESDDEEQEEEESEFEVSDDEPEDEDEDSEEFASEDDSEGDFDSEEESGEDWDELEKQAAAEDGEPPRKKR
ncbi:FACT complex subunit SPT16 [Yarrowia sp. B02]|nr:FACT complex subunit SPT16 [Yarrowia sp. B02]